MPKSAPIVIVPEENRLIRIITISRDGITTDTKSDKKDETEIDNCSQ